MNIANIFDLILLVLLIIVAFRYAKQGFVAGLVQFLGNVASLIGALVISRQVSPLVFSQFFENSFVNKIETTLSSGGEIGLQDTVEKYAGFLPEALKNSIIASGNNLLSDDAPELASHFVQEVIAPLVTPIIAVVVFFVAFALCKLLVGFIVAVLTNCNRIPVLGGVNKLLGFVMGLFAGTVDLYLILCAVCAIIVITGGSIQFLNETTLQGSIAYQLFRQFNPFY